MEHQRYGEVFNFGVLHMDWPTALFVLAVFVVTMILLNALLFKPLLTTLEARNQAMSGGNERLMETERELKALETHYQDSLRAGQKENEAAHKKALAEALAGAKEITDQARANTQLVMEKAEAEIAGESQQALKDAKELAQGLADLIQNKVLAS